MPIEETTGPNKEEEPIIDPKDDDEESANEPVATPVTSPQLLPNQPPPGPKPKKPGTFQKGHPPFRKKADQSPGQPPQISPKQPLFDPYTGKPLNSVPAPTPTPAQTPKPPPELPPPPPALAPPPSPVTAPAPQPKREETADPPGVSKPIEQEKYVQRPPPTKAPPFGAKMDKLSPGTKWVAEHLQGNKPFVIPIKEYSDAISEMILSGIDASDANGGSFPSHKINFHEAQRKKLKLQSGSYAILYKGGKMPDWIVPFLWQLDTETLRTWAVFKFNDFYNKKASMLPWKRFWTTIILTPFDKNADVVDDFADGYLAKYDEDTQFQMRMNYGIDEETRKAMIDNKNFISAALQLWMDLSKYTKPKFNLILLLIVICLAAAAILGYVYISKNPQFLSGITSIFNPKTFGGGG